MERSKTPRADGRKPEVQANSKLDSDYHVPKKQHLPETVIYNLARYLESP
jgi:hypothetical protein